MSLWKPVTLGALLVGLVLLAGTRGTTTPGLDDTFPAGVPDPTGWETSSGSADFASPAHTVEYKLYVSPERGGFYTFTRYRIAYDDPAERERRGISATEKLQWDVDGHTVHRYECVPAADAGEPCQWHELPVGSPEFKRETGNLLFVYDLHRKLLYRRDHPSPQP